MRASWWLPGYSRHSTSGGIDLADRRCPYCGERVPSFSVNCPNCYRNLPPEEPKKDEYRIIDDDRAPSVHTVNRKAVIFLALIPGVFGFFGLGHLYQKDWHKGILFLLTGILMMFTMVMMLSVVGGPVGIFFFIGLLILFIGAYLLQAFDAIVRSLFRF